MDLLKTLRNPGCCQKLIKKHVLMFLSPKRYFFAYFTFFTN